MSETIVHDNEFMSGQVPGAYFKVSGYLMRIMFDENRQMYFIGCSNCKKKVQEIGNQMYRCETCNLTLNEQQVRVTYTVVGKF